ncbi:PAS domain-containing sensor histidine kinase [Methanoregula sp.]|uniref:PAS domain-containing sensor histidine kinase n=1 Tax=Methanoregula sp. TaxID=2052170 RepID=UPI002D02029D|nr:PAS domain-containing sensor histidine kinase [Methanoregula sp.]HVP96930.1 PAS domain-containing sensor histidine kinase [Methanoregula sp.]
MTMRPLSRNRQLFYDICIVGSIVASVLITYISIQRGIYEVFPYFYLIPLVLIAYSRPKLSIYGSILIGWIYVALVFIIGLPDIKTYILATIWFYIFVSLGILISTYSQAYRKESARSCGTYYNSQAGAFSYDRETLMLREVNLKFATMIRYSPEELMQKSLSDIIPDREERESFISKTRDLRRVGDIEVRIRAGDGSTRWVLVSAAETGEPVVVCTAVDITETKLAQESLTQANKKLNLLNNVTRHDILNQLSALLGFLELSRQKTTDPQLIDYLAREEQAANAIRSQILFTRDYQNIGVHSPQWHNVPETVSLALASIDLHSILVDMRIPAVEIYADPLLEKVFYNLIENSIRHGERVSRIDFSCRESGTGIILRYHDNGVGVSPDDKDRLFQKGFGKNTGLGLFLSQEILSITGLTITEKGEPGKGACFEIAVPREAYRFTDTLNKSE